MWLRGRDRRVLAARRNKGVQYLGMRWHERTKEKDLAASTRTTAHVPGLRCYHVPGLYLSGGTRHADVRLQVQEVREAVLGGAADQRAHQPGAGLPEVQVPQHVAAAFRLLRPDGTEELTTRRRLGV